MTDFASFADVMFNEEDLRSMLEDRGDDVSDELFDYIAEHCYDEMWDRLQDAGWEILRELIDEAMYDWEEEER